MDIIQEWCAQCAHLYGRSGPVGGRFTGRQKTLCGHGSFNLLRVSPCFARLAGLKFAFLQRAVKLK